MTQSVFKAVIARYKTILENQKNGLNRVLKSLSMTLFRIEIILLHRIVFFVNTLYGRVKRPYFTQGMDKYFNHNGNQLSSG